MSSCLLHDLAIKCDAEFVFIAPGRHIEPVDQGNPVSHLRISNAHCFGIVQGCPGDIDFQSRADEDQVEVSRRKAAPVILPRQAEIRNAGPGGYRNRHYHQLCRYDLPLRRELWDRVGHRQYRHVDRDASGVGPVAIDADPH